MMPRWINPASKEKESINHSLARTHIEPTNEKEAISQFKIEYKIKHPHVCQFSRF
jgi:putative IMPACT (imprinted ancient) family translation regulator